MQCYTPLTYLHNIPESISNIQLLNTRSPDPLAGFKRPTSKERMGREGKERGENVEFNHILLSNLTTDNTK